MRVSKDYILRRIGEDFVIMPSGQAPKRFGGLITVNEVGVSIWNLLQQDVTVRDILNGILDEYEVEEDVAEEDILEFLKTLSDSGILEKGIDEKTVSD